MRGLARVQADGLESLKRLSTRGGMHQERCRTEKCKTEVQSRSAEKGNVDRFVLSHVPESGHGAPILWVVSEDREKQMQVLRLR